MFWKIMHKVHNLPENHNSSDPWWTEEEQPLKALVEYQLSYNRLSDDKLSHPVWKDPNDDCTCLGPVDGFENGEDVLTLGEGYKQFFEQHLNIGKYVGTVTYQGATERQLKEGWLETGLEEFLEDLRGDIEAYDEQGDDEDAEEMRGILQRFETAAEKGEDTYQMFLEDNDIEMDVETVWIFEQGSIMFAHYGRGAGISVRLHKNIPSFSGQTGQELIDLFKSLNVE